MLDYTFLLLIFFNIKSPMKIRHANIIIPLIILTIIIDSRYELLKDLLAILTNQSLLSFKPYFSLFLVSTQKKLFTKMDNLAFMELSARGYSPPPFLTLQHLFNIKNLIIYPTIRPVHTHPDQ